MQAPHCAPADRRGRTERREALRAFRASPILLAVLALVAAVAVAFAPALECALLSWDDSTYLADSAVRGTTLLAERLVSIVSSFYFSNYNPLHRIGNWLQLAAFGPAAYPLHMVSLLLHASASLLVLRLLRKLGCGVEASLAGALIFAVHPSRAEVVAWFSAQKDLGSVACALLALNVYAPLLTDASARRGWRLVSTGGLFLLAVLYKSMLVTFPLLLLVLDLAWRRPFRTAILEKAPFFAAALLFAALTVEAAPSAGPLGATWEAHAATALQAPWYYLERVFAPLEYSARHWIPRRASLLEPAAAWSAAGVLAAGVAAVWLGRGRRRRALLLIVGWPLAAMLPVLNIVPIPIVVADRYLYLALLGPVLAFAELYERMGSRSTRALARTVVLLLVLGCTLLARRHASAFQDDLTLWRRSFAAQPENPVVRLFLAQEILDQGGRAAALEALELLDAPATDPLAGSQLVLLARARVFRALGRDNEAEREHRRALEAADREGWRAELAIAEAMRLDSLGLRDAAHRVLERAEVRSGGERDRLDGAHFDLALRAGDLESALGWNGRQLERRPFSLVHWSNREQLARRLGREEEAARAGARFEAIAGGVE